MPQIRILSILVVIGANGWGCATRSSSLYRNPEFEIGSYRRVAVLPFGDAPRYPGSGAVMASLFETALMTSGKLEVVERGELDRILRERRSGATGEADDPVIVGKLVRADLVIIGKVTNWHQGWSQSLWQGQPTSVGASVKAIGVRRGSVLWAFDESTKPGLFDNIPLDGPVDAVARKLSQRMVAELIGPGSVRSEETPRGRSQENPTGG
jgi:hypothetical protein